MSEIDRDGEGRMRRAEEHDPLELVPPPREEQDEDDDEDGDEEGETDDD